MKRKHSGQLGGWLVAGLLLSLGCGSGATTGNGDSAAQSGSGGSSGSDGGSGITPSEAGIESGADSTGISSESGSDASDATTDAQGDSGQPNADAGGCPVLPVPGTCAPPTDIRCPYPKLSQTGCVDPANPLKLASVVIPYEVNSPLWSDGALKTRGIRIPAGQKIHVKDCVKNPMECCVKDPAGACLPPADDGKWVLPVGTVMVKNFQFADTSQASGIKFVETRLFVHMDHVDPISMSDWVGYSYQWNEAQTEATITSSSDPNTDMEATAVFQVKPTAAAATQSVTWIIPSRAECMRCHKAITPTGGSTLGIETMQLNRIAKGDTMNQIDKLAMMGLFDTVLAKPYKAALVAPYVGQAGAPPAGASLDVRARSYLHANCSFCHRPDSDVNTMDMRFDVPFKDTHLCNGMPGKGDQGVPGALLVTPKNPMSSIVLLRMSAPPADLMTGSHGRMPPIATWVVDTSGTTLISDWIKGIAACPP